MIFFTLIAAISDEIAIITTLQFDVIDFCGAASYTTHHTSTASAAKYSAPTMFTIIISVYRLSFLGNIMTLLMLASMNATSLSLREY